MVFAASVSLYDHLKGIRTTYLIPRSYGIEKGDTTLKELGFLRPLRHPVSRPMTYICPTRPRPNSPKSLVRKKNLLNLYRGEACSRCGRKIKKTYNNGYCYKCFKVFRR